MPEIRFYHLQTMNAEQALPGLVSRAYDGGKRIVLRLKDEAQVKRVDDLLWTYNPNSFLPHGAEGGKAVSGSAPEDHPVWLTLANDNANNADTLITLDVSGGDWPDGFDLICLMFEGRDEASLNAARALWKTLQDKGADLTYWQQTAQGGWEKKQ